MSGPVKPASKAGRWCPRTSRKWEAMSVSSRRSRPVSRSVPWNVATIDSVGGCDVPPAMEEIAVSTTSTPASAAFSRVPKANPAVSWVWNWTGRLTCSLMRVTRS